MQGENACAQGDVCIPRHACLSGCRGRIFLLGTDENTWRKVSDEFQNRAAVRYYKHFLISCSIQTLEKLLRLGML